MNNQVVSGILLGAAIVASAWVVSKSLERSAAASRALAVAQFCAMDQPSSIQVADCDHFGRQLRLAAWVDLLPPPDADTVGRGEDHDQ